MNQIKNSFLKKKSGQTVDRHTVMMNPSEVKTVLLISNNDHKSLKRKVEELFPSSSVYHLFPREIKEDRTVGFYYSVHKSDFNLTGAVKNDKLRNLEKMQIDLLLDLSFGSELLNYFVGRVKSGLKVGDIKSSKAHLYDLMVEFESDELVTADNIFNRMMNFTQHASE